MILFLAGVAVGFLVPALSLVVWGLALLFQSDCHVKAFLKRAAAEKEPK